MRTKLSLITSASFLLLTACNQAGTGNTQKEIEGLRLQNVQLARENQILQKKVASLDSIVNVMLGREEAYKSNLKDVEDDLEDVISFLNGMGY